VIALSVLVSASAGPWPGHSMIDDGSAAIADATVAVPIPGRATIRIQFDSGDVAANIDYFTLSG
jgi:hypothetical protein